MGLQLDVTIMILCGGIGNYSMSSEIEKLGKNFTRKVPKID